jgi:short-subunit dehydrogenase
MNNKIAITGHCRGIGQALFKALSMSNTCIGFDLEQGYDISRDRERILHESMDCNVFINNAYYNDEQAHLAREWHALHIEDEFIIINISSISAELLYSKDDNNAKNITEKIQNIRYHTYSLNKYSLNVASQEINRSKNKCKSIVIMPSNIETGFKTTFNRIEQNTNLLKPSDIVAAVEMLINYSNQERFIPLLTIEST